MTCPWDICRVGPACLVDTSWIACGTWKQFKFVYDDGSEGSTKDIPFILFTLGRRVFVTLPVVAVPVVSFLAITIRSRLLLTKSMSKRVIECARHGQ